MERVGFVGLGTMGRAMAGHIARAGYSLTVHRTAFTPADLPLAIARSGGALAPIPIAPAADLTLASTTAPSAATGDTWATSLGFSAPLPLLAPAHYAATVTYTVIGR